MLDIALLIRQRCPFIAVRETYVISLHIVFLTIYRYFLVLCYLNDAICTVSYGIGVVKGETDTLGITGFC